MKSTLLFSLLVFTLAADADVQCEKGPVVAGFGADVMIDSLGSTAISPNGQYAYIVLREPKKPDYNPLIGIWDYKAQRFTYQTTMDWVFNVRAKFSSDSKLVAIAARDRLFVVKTDQTNSAPKSFEKYSNTSIFDYQFLPDGKRIAILETDCVEQVCKGTWTLSVYDVTSGQPVARFQFSSSGGYSTGIVDFFAQDNQHLLVMVDAWGKDLMIHTVDIASGEDKTIYVGPSQKLLPRMFAGLTTNAIVFSAPLLTSYGNPGTDNNGTFLWTKGSDKKMSFINGYPIAVSNSMIGLFDRTTALPGNDLAFSGPLTVLSEAGAVIKNVDLGNEPIFSVRLVENVEPSKNKVLFIDSSLKKCETDF